SQLPPTKTRSLGCSISSSTPITAAASRPMSKERCVAAPVSSARRYGRASGNRSNECKNREEKNPPFSDFGRPPSRRPWLGAKLNADRGAGLSRRQRRPWRSGLAQRVERVAEPLERHGDHDVALRCVLELEPPRLLLGAHFLDRSVGQVGLGQAARGNAPP